MFQKTVLGIATAAILMQANSAAAEWTYQEHSSAFSGPTTHLALATSNHYAMGLRCTSRDDLTLIFMTPEQVDADTAKVLNATQPKLLLRIDSNPIHEIAAIGEPSETGFAIFGNTTSDISNEIAAASSSISIAIQMLGKTYNEARFDAINSTSTVGKLSNLCDLTS